MAQKLVFVQTLIISLSITRWCNSLYYRD